MEKKNIVRRQHVLHITKEHHRAIRYIAIRDEVPIHELTTEALDAYFAQRIGSNWREKTAMDN